MHNYACTLITACEVAFGDRVREDQMMISQGRRLRIVHDTVHRFQGWIVATVEKLWWRRAVEGI